MSNEHVAEAAARAVKVLEALANKEEVPLQLPEMGTKRLPPRDLMQCSGLCFTFVRKAGVGLTAEHGTGFLLAHQAGDGGSWSAPLFISLSAGGVGISLGAAEIDSIVVLSGPEAMAKYSQPYWDTAADVTTAAPVIVNSSDGVKDLDLGMDSFTYSVSKGLMMDYSFKGMRYRLDDALNKAVYGEACTPKDILEGKVTVPDAIKPLHNALVQYATTGGLKPYESA